MVSGSVLEKIADFIFGHRYYANIINTRGTDKCEVCSYIFRTREQAKQHRKTIDSTLSFLYIETVSFRSYKDYKPE